MPSGVLYKRRWCVGVNGRMYHVVDSRIRIVQYSPTLIDGCWKRLLYVPSRLHDVIVLRVNVS